MTNKKPSEKEAQRPPKDRDEKKKLEVEKESVELDDEALDNAAGGIANVTEYNTCGWGCGG